MGKRKPKRKLCFLHLLAISGTCAAALIILIIL